MGRGQGPKGEELTREEVLGKNVWQMFPDHVDSVSYQKYQPLAAIAANAGACVRWLGADKPDLEEARVAARRIISDAQRTFQFVLPTGVSS